jgi:hypothetical protein
MYRAGSLRAIAEEISKYVGHSISNETNYYCSKTAELIHMKMLLVDFNAKVAKEDIFKPTI